MTVGDVIFWVWIAGTLVSLLPIARWWMREIFEDSVAEADGADLAMAAMMAIVCAPFWPLLIPGAWIYHVLRLDAEGRR